MIIPEENNKTFRLTVFLILFIPFSVPAQSIPFKHITTNNGLSNNSVNNLIQDKTGFLWFTTEDGLNRFDGYDFKIFRSDQSNKNFVSDNATLAITEDEEGKIWIGSKSGSINCYDPVYNKFKSWQIKLTLEKDNPINVIHIDHKSNIWAGTYRNGLYRLNPKTGEIKNWRNNPKDSNSLSNNYISSIVEDDKNNLWIGTYYGLNKFSPDESENQFKRFFNLKDRTNSLSDNTIWAITKSIFEENTLLIGTANGITTLDTESELLKTISIPNPTNLMFGTGAGSIIEEIINGEKIFWTNSYAGLLRYNKTRNSFDRFLSDKYDINSLRSNQIVNIYKDRSGVIWIATDKGLNYFSNKNSQFNGAFLSSENSFEPGELGKMNIKALAKTSDGTLWFGTEQGLFYSLKSGTKKNIKKYSALKNYNIWTLAAGKENELWIGTYGSGLFLLNPKTNTLTPKPILDNIIKSSSRNFIKSLYLDSQNRLWVGYWGIGLARIDFNNGEVKHWQSKSNDENSLSYDDVWVIFEDSKSRIWIGTNGGGLNIYDNKNDSFFRFNTFNKSKIKLSSNGVYSIIQSGIKTSSNNESILWVGTNKGLNKITIDDSIAQNAQFPTIKRVGFYTVQNGLIDNSIKSIVEDNGGNLWLGTSSGISFYDVAKNTFTNYSSSEGVTGNDFNSSSSLKVSEDLILMGSTSGINLFNPNQIVQSNYIPPLVLTDFQIFNNSVEPDSNSVLSRSISSTKEITLSYTQSVFSFQYSAFDYNSPASINYSYMMQGFDKDWIAGGSRRFITYTNLNPGKYVFKVKSTNSDGVWYNNTTTVAITINPPWWQTVWAVLLYFVVFVTGIWGIIKFQVNRHRLQNELKIREFESYHLREIEQMKSRFFANLSHEFRTPLMLIKGPLESLISGKINDNTLGYYKMLLRNTEKLQLLIDQLLELSQLEADSIPLKVDLYDIVDVVKSCYNNFMSIAQQKKINYSFYSTQESVNSIIDKDKLEKIINNLLSNALKFTSKNGSIFVEITKLETKGLGAILISVKDNGIGIPQESLEKIFDRFYQADNSSKRNYGGSGIGLALVKELATVNKWDIDVKSEENAGTEFTLNIPLTSNFTSEYKKQQVNDLVSAVQPDNEVVSNRSLADQLSSGNSLILLVEDSEDVRTYVNDLLKKDYKILLADSGEEGIELTKNNLPDLIISDVMMTGMDGFEFCKRIKSDWKTSDIPIILLTAKVDHQSKLDGLELGADDYITKPFNHQELLIRIKNLIAKRKGLKNKYGKKILRPTVGSKSYNKEEHQLIDKAVKVIEKYLFDENFNTEILAKELFMSRSQLSRKLHSINGQGPGEFIRTYKLNRSAKMILEKKLSITQIAYEVGFGSPAQFTRAFQKYFNCLPSEFSLTNHTQKV